MTELQVGSEFAVATVTPPEPEEPSVSELEDLLYDILASGADPSFAEGTLEAVQTFIHEHARSKRTRAEFLAFFAGHGLSTAKEDTLTFALPPMEPRETREETHEPAPALPERQESAQPIEPGWAPAPAQIAPPAPRRTVWAPLAWVAGIVALAAISGGAYLAVTLARAELSRIRSEARANAALIERVQAEAANLRQSVQQNAEDVRRVDHKSELLLQTLGSPLDPNTR